MSSFVLMSLIAVAQQGGEAFEVASIHSNNGGSGNTQISRQAGGRLIVNNASAKTLIRNAYGILGFQLEGGPKWLEEDKFDINAVTVSRHDISENDLQPLMQQLLAERFQFKAHWETREVPIYVLVLAKGGTKMQPYGGAPEHGMNTRRGPDRTQMTSTNVAMSELATNLGNQLGHYVSDETGLTGRYDFVLHFDPNQTADSQEPSLFTALREQLGLQLEARKGPMRVLVIDTLEHPSKN
jgi:uncharacterized protein (TIGR03435 family)